MTLRTSRLRGMLLGSLFANGGAGQSPPLRRDLVAVAHCASTSGISPPGSSRPSCLSTPTTFHRSKSQPLLDPAGPGRCTVAAPPPAGNPTGMHSDNSFPVDLDRPPTCVEWDWTPMGSCPIQPLLHGLVALSSSTSGIRGLCSMSSTTSRARASTTPSPSSSSTEFTMSLANYIAFPFSFSAW